MTSTTPVEVQVIFDASSRSRRGAGVVRPVSRVSGGRGWHTLGCTHLVVAALLYYVIWWHADPFIYLTLMLKTPVAVDYGAAASIFVPSQRPTRSTPSNPAAPPVPSARATQVLIGATAYGWLGLSTVSTCALALAAGAALGRFRGVGWRNHGRLAASLVVLTLVAGTYGVLHAYGRQYLPSHLRMGMGGLGLLAVAVGATTGRFARGLSRWASVGLIAAGLGTAVALKLGAKAEAIEPQHAAWWILSLAFLVPSLYGAVTVPLVRRLP